VRISVNSRNYRIENESEKVLLEEIKSEKNHHFFNIEEEEENKSFSQLSKSEFCWHIKKEILKRS
jgi:hypothetical protein